MDSHPDPEPNSNLHEEIIYKIKKWFKEEGYTIEEVSNPTTYFDANVYYVTNTGYKTTHIHVTIPKDSTDKINVGTIFGYKITEESSDFFKDADKANKVHVSLLDTLDSLNINFTTNAAPEDIEINISKTIYFDGFSKHILFETSGDVLTAYRILDLTYKRTLKVYDSSGDDKN